VRIRGNAAGRECMANTNSVSYGQLVKAAVIHRSLRNGVRLPRDLGALCHCGYNSLRRNAVNVPDLVQLTVDPVDTEKEAPA